MPVPAITVTERDLRDQFLPAYEAFQMNGTSWDGRPGGRAEAIMCSYAAFDGVPSCANKRLLQVVLPCKRGVVLFAFRKYAVSLSLVKRLVFFLLCVFLAVRLLH